MKIDLKQEDLAFLNPLADHLYKIAADHGFHENDNRPERVAEYVANLHDEVSELWQAYRAGELFDLCEKAHKMSDMGLEPLSCIEEELADIVIRALDTAKAHGVDMARAIFNKSAYNESRPYKHGKVA